jgi:hypothetical protein
MAAITYQFFNFNYFRTCPPDVMREIFVWLPIDEFTPVPSVCREWLEISRSDEIWLTFYQYKFLRNNTVMASMPERPLPLFLSPPISSFHAVSTSSSSTLPSPLRHHRSFPTPGITSDTYPTSTTTHFEKTVAWTLESQQQGGYYLHAFKLHGEGNFDWKRAKCIKAWLGMYLFPLAIMQTIIPNL